MNRDIVNLDVSGKRFVVERVGERWRACEVRSDGKRSLIGIAIPDSLDESAIAQYFDDVYHEAATLQRPNVSRLD